MRAAAVREGKKKGTVPDDCARGTTPTYRLGKKEGGKKQTTGELILHGRV